jgi:hypothetical protein
VRIIVDLAASRSSEQLRGSIPAARVCRVRS